MTEKIRITEEDKVHEEWYREARNMTPEAFPEFFERLTTAYQHDYGTVVHSVAAIAIGAAWAANKRSGITGFQAGCVMWEFIRRWMSMDGPLALVQYENLLYPQYADRFEKTITPETHEWLKEQAAKHLAEHTQKEELDYVHPDVVDHWRRITQGWLPFNFTVAEE